MFSNSPAPSGRQDHRLSVLLASLFHAPLSLVLFPLLCSPFYTSLSHPPSSHFLQLLLSLALCLVALLPSVSFLSFSLLSFWTARLRLLPPQLSCSGIVPHRPTSKYLLLARRPVFPSSRPRNNKVRGDSSAISNERLIAGEEKEAGSRRWGKATSPTAEPAR